MLTNRWILLFWGNWKTRKRGNGNGNGNNLKDVENISQSRGHTFTKSSHELAPHWVHSSICKLIPGIHSRFIIVGPRVVVYWLSSSQVDGYTILAGLVASDSHTINRLRLGLGDQLQAYDSTVICPACWLNDPTQEFQSELRAQCAGVDCARLVYRALNLLTVSSLACVSFA